MFIGSTDQLTGRERSQSGFALLLVLALLVPSSFVPADDASGRKPAYRGLIWHAETLDGRVLDSKQADRQVNPASLVKVATTLWALEKLGPECWFETRVQATGELDEANGSLQGDLIVFGSGDPDFQPENGFMVALKLNRLGIKRIEGRLLVNDRFWIGWEGGTGKTIENRTTRARVMAARLRRALDPHRWDRKTQRTWRKFASRHGLPYRPMPRVSVSGDYGLNTEDLTGRSLLVHRSKPLAEVLRRFNCYSNNDIERLSVSIGEPADMAATLRNRWSLPADAISFETTSGLGTNRMTPRLVVRLLRELVKTCSSLGLSPGDVLPVTGCDPGTLRQFFPRLNQGKHAASVTGKTGTLIYTDGGVSAFAGIAETGSGSVLFCVVVPRGGRKRHWARRQQENWVLDLIDGAGGPKAGICPPPLPMPDTGAQVMVWDEGSEVWTLAPGH